MVYISRFGLLLLVLLEDEWLGAAETVVQLPDRLGVAQGQALVLAGQLFGEIVEVLQVALDFNRGV